MWWMLILVLILMLKSVHVVDRYKSRRYPKQIDMTVCDRGV